MKLSKALSSLLALLFAFGLLFAGCGERAEEAPPSPSPTAATSFSPTSETPPQETPANSGEPTAGEGPEASAAPSAEQAAESAVAWMFGDIGGSPALYAAASFVNPLSTAAVVESVTIEITDGNTTVSETFVPPMAGLDAILPGARSTAAVWVSGSDAFDRDAALTASAKVVLRESPGAEASELSVGDLLLVQNYPGFATLSGRIHNASAEDCSLAMVYVSCYDAAGALLGVTSFTKDLAIPAGESRDFVVHLQDLPIPDLAENTETVVCRALWLG